MNDHARALLKVVKHGRIGLSNVGGVTKGPILKCNSNLQVDGELAPNKPEHVDRYDDSCFVEDRRLDLRYAIDSSKIQDELKWQCRNI